MHAKCMFRYFDGISYLNVFFEYFEMFSFESYFAWICSFCMDVWMFFHLNVIFKIT